MSWKLAEHNGSQKNSQWATFDILKFSLIVRPIEETNKINESTWSFDFLCLHPVSLSALLNFNILKVVYYLHNMCLQGMILVVHVFNFAKSQLCCDKITMIPTVCFMQGITHCFANSSLQ